jgi:hypothetical protein
VLRASGTYLTSASASAATQSVTSIVFDIRQDVTLRKCQSMIATCCSRRRLNATSSARECAVPYLRGGTALSAVKARWILSGV